MAEFALEPDETRVFRHAPGWVDLAIVAAVLVAELAVVAAVSGEMKAEPMRYDSRSLALVFVLSLFAGAVLQFLVLVMPPLVEITGSRVLRRRRLGWDDPDMLWLDEIESVEQRGWRLVLQGGGESLGFFCPPTFAPRIHRAITEARGTTGHQP